MTTILIVFTEQMIRSQAHRTPQQYTIKWLSLKRSAPGPPRLHPAHAQGTQNNERIFQEFNSNELQKMSSHSDKIHYNTTSIIICC